MNCAIAIPALNPSMQLLTFLDELCAYGIEHIIVIDDGSGEKYKQVFLEASRKPGCVILTHEQNYGKGRALRTAFAYFKEHLSHLDGIVTADADGQHRSEDVIKVANAVNPHANRIVLGARTFRHGTTPFRSLFGNRVTSRIFQMLYGVFLKDTQTGLRGIPTSAVDWALTCRGDRYEYELDFLIVARRRRYQFYEIDIDTLYFNDNEGSHYNTIKDGFRVFVMMISGLAKYFYSSILSAVADVVAFFIFNTFVFTHMDAGLRLFLSTLIARVLSSCINFSMNRSVFSHGPKVPGQMLRYYMLWCMQLLASYGLVYLFSFFIPSDMISKIIIDIVLAIFSYQIQLHWVFRGQEHPTESGE